MIDYEEDWLFPLLFKQKGSVYIRSFSFAFPSALMALAVLVIERQGMATFREEAGVLHHNSSVLWSAVTSVLIFLVGFRTRQGLARFWEGTGLLHQMKGEWFDTVSNCVTFTIASGKKDPKKKPLVEQFRHTIVRLMSLCHGSALEEISGGNVKMETIDVQGLNRPTLLHLKDCVENFHFNKVEVLLHLVQSLITDAHELGIINIPPPILSRVYQTISRGYVNLLNTKKITDTKFPFPYVQLITLLLILHTLMAPFAITAIIDHVVWAPIFTFIPVFGSHALNFISIELEDPFGEDDNDLPLSKFQAEMNNCLLMLLHPNTDIIAGIDDSKCILQFDKLLDSVNIEEHEEDAKGSGPQKRTSVHLFDPSFRIVGSSRSNLNMAEVVTAMDSRNSFAPSLGFSAGSNTDGGEGETSSEPAIEVTQGIAEGNDVAETLASRQGMEGPGGRFLFPEPKLLHDTDLDALLVRCMEEFNNTLQMWTSKMEEQVREMAESFANVGMGLAGTNGTNGHSVPRPETIVGVVAGSHGSPGPGQQVYRERVRQALGAVSPPRLGLQPLQPASPGLGPLRPPAGITR